MKAKFEWIEETDFSQLEPITQIYSICFDEKGDILIINVNNKWQLPGGKPEEGESFEETLSRESEEEADVEIENIRPLGYQKVTEEDNSVIYQLRFVSNVKKIKKQTEDPAEGKINQRKFIKPEDFLDYCNWGTPGKQMIKAATENHNIYK
jgi:ADP-ribose pyrophosphatase YjhB (NUDIX family)